MADHQEPFRVLIVDEDPSSHKIFHDVLSKNKASTSYSIDSVSSSEEAINQLKKAVQEKIYYALIFIDIHVAKNVRTIKALQEIDPNVQIILCTKEFDDSYQDIIKRLDMSDNFFIFKKLSDVHFIHQLAYTLSRKWKRTQELQYQITHDPLTQLPNRKLLFEKLQYFINLANQHKSIFAIIFIDLDRFRLINSSLTYFVGDKFLQAIATRFQHVINHENHMLARFGGDEFVLIANNLSKEEDAVQISQRIFSATHEFFKIAHHELGIGSHIGIALYPKDGGTPDTLLRNADLAMCHAKKRGVNNFQFYTKDIDVDSLKQLELENKLRKAITNNEFVLHYQPVFNLVTGKLEGVEALIRWIDPEKGWVPPLEFISVAEESGLIVPIGEWVITTACKQNKAWQKAGLPLIRVAINIAVQQFEQENLISIVKNALEESKLDPMFLELELTENSVINSPKVIEKIVALKKMGIQITLDDFGTGYSSLSYLKKLPLDRIKIDRAYTQNIHVSKNDESIIRAIIAMATSLDLHVLAEGVENISQMKFLQQQECNEAQGFYFCKPLSVADMSEFLKKYQENKA